MTKKTSKIYHFSNFTFGDGVLFTFFILSLIIGIKGIELYRLTIIHPGNLILPILISGICFTLVVLRIPNSYHKSWTIFQGLVGGAFIGFFTMLYVNLNY